MTDEQDPAVNDGPAYGPPPPLAPEPPAEVAVTPNRVVATPEARKAIYGAAAAVGAVLVVFGLVTDEQVSAILNVVGAVITVLPLVLAFVNTPKKG